MSPCIHSWSEDTSAEGSCRLVPKTCRERIAELENEIKMIVHSALFGTPPPIYLPDILALREGSSTAVLSVELPEGLSTDLQCGTFFTVPVLLFGRKGKRHKTEVTVVCALEMLHYEKDKTPCTSKEGFQKGVL